ncbi:MAG: 50S ribosome-binding GTPase [Nanoarchaeota archaeon]|nr:50S ribosome-binding GTPase [Nanoarchaeota archaeon]
MNFQTLPQALNSSKYLDMAFGEAKKQANMLQKRGSKEAMEKKKCFRRLRISEKVLCAHLTTLLEKYPKFDELPDFYLELAAITIDIDSLKKGLSTVSWAIKKIEELTNMYANKAHISEKPTEVWKAYYGRVSSVLKRLDKHLYVIEQSRKTLKSYPDIKENYTVCLAGFPNAGKSTLLSKITSAKPEIKAYAFTTKSLNMGYFETYFHKVQVIDTPGTLNRLNNMNNIEKQAYLAMKHCANLLVYVFDPTYDTNKQLKLLETLEELKLPIILYVTKTDLAKPEIDMEYISSPQTLKKELGTRFKSYLSKNPTSS